MLGRDFTGWSEHMLVAVRQRHRLPHLLRPVPGRDQEARRRPRPSCCAAYKLSLANLILNFKPLISPSTFLLDVKGQPARPDTPENLAAARFCGLDAESEFCPLPADLRAPGTELFEHVRGPVRRVRRAGGRADDPGVQVVYGPGRAGGRDDAAGRRGRDVRRQPADPPRPVRRARRRARTAVRPARSAG